MHREILTDSEWKTYWCPLSKDMCKGSRCAFWQVYRVDKEDDNKLRGRCIKE